MLNTLKEKYEKAEKYFKDIIQKNNIKYYDIVEDTYKFENGLILIVYEDKEHQYEKDIFCVDVNEF